jgi:hypothetical protein
MSRSRIAPALAAAAALCAGLAGCGNLSSLSVAKSSLDRPQPHPSATPPYNAPVACPVPPALVPRDPKTAVTVEAWLASASGRFQLEAITLYQGSYAAHLDATASSPLFQVDCGVPARDVALTVAETVYAPSGRVTVYDAGTPQLDDPRFNFPTLVDVTIGADGGFTYLHAQSRLGGAPYLTHLSLAEAIAGLPSDTLLFARADGHPGFELRVGTVARISYRLSP